MFEYQFSNGSNAKLKYNSDVIEEQSPMIWGEHCVECSAPECYFSCKRFVARADGHCRRFKNGIEPQVYNGAPSIQVAFKSWAKLEAILYPKVFNSSQYIKLENRINILGRICSTFSSFMPGFKLKSKWTGAWYRFFEWQRKIQGGFNPHSSFSLNTIIVNNDKPSFVLIDLVAANNDLLSRDKVYVGLGETPVNLKLSRVREAHHISIRPSNVDEELTLTFVNLRVVPVPEEQKKEKKVKCVIWDLDNTLWDGVLVERESVSPKPEFVDLIKRLDAKGIVNSIASKNNEEQVVDVLKQAGIDDLFVFKKINWEPKSQNILNTIKGMNINANTFVFVDDNPFERDEVKTAIPDITCVDPTDILVYAETERFDVPISEETAKRRDTYKLLEQLNKEQEAWTGNIDSFLINCHITLTISTPTEDNIPRCFELLQRTNQLNSSGRRLSMEELTDILNNKDYHCYVMESTDKFGSYGIVGFMIVKMKDTPCITDFVISCRVANKKIEPTIINYLAGKFGGEILFNFKKTKLNGPMKKVIDELQMEKNSEMNEMESYVHKYFESYPHIVEIIDKSYGKI